MRGGDRRRPLSVKSSWRTLGPISWTATGLPSASRTPDGTSCRTISPRDLLFAILAGHYVNAIQGVIRTDAQRRTRVMPLYVGGDYRLMAELSVLGKFVEIPERLFVRRIHKGSSAGNTGNAGWLRTYLSGSRPGMHNPYWRLCRDHAGIVMRAPIPLARKAVLLAQLARTKGKSVV